MADDSLCYEPGCTFSFEPPNVPCEATGDCVMLPPITVIAPPSAGLPGTPVQPPGYPSLPDEPFENVGGIPRPSPPPVRAGLPSSSVLRPGGVPKVAAPPTIAAPAPSPSLAIPLGATFLPALIAEVVPPAPLSTVYLDELLAQSIEATVQEAPPSLIEQAIAATQNLGNLLARAIESTVQTSALEEPPFDYFGRFKLPPTTQELFPELFTPRPPLPPPPPPPAPPLEAAPVAVEELAAAEEAVSPLGLLAPATLFAQLMTYAAPLGPTATQEAANVASQLVFDPTIVPISPYGLLEPVAAISPESLGLGPGNLPLPTLIAHAPGATDPVLAPLVAAFTDPLALVATLPGLVPQLAPLPFTVPRFAPRGRPRLGPSARPGTRPRFAPGSAAAPLTQPQLQPQPKPALQTLNEKCMAPKEKPKKKDKPKKNQRDRCYRGTYRQLKRGTIFHRIKEVPCQ